MFPNNDSLSGLALGIIGAYFLIFFGFMFNYYGSFIDDLLFGPVVANGQIKNIQFTKYKDLSFEFYTDKLRECKFERVLVYAINNKDKKVRIHYSPETENDPELAGQPVGKMNYYGRFKINISALPDAERIEFDTYHTCGLFYPFLTEKKTTIINQKIFKEMDEINK